MTHIRALAEALGDLSPEQIEAALQGFLDAGEDRALGRLLQVCAFNEVKLDPKVLCGSIGVCEDILDSAPCFALQLSDLLPEHPPRSVVGGTYTVRRPVAKLGRNDPCHCGRRRKRR